jgi:hypothetical protein
MRQHFQTTEGESGEIRVLDMLALLDLRFVKKKLNSVKNYQKFALKFCIVKKIIESKLNSNENNKNFRAPKLYYFVSYIFLK